MSSPLVDKSMAGLLRKHEKDITSLFRRLTFLRAQSAPVPLPEAVYAPGPATHTITFLSGNWGPVGASASITPDADLYVDIVASAIAKASEGYTMLGLNVTGGVTVGPLNNPDGTGENFAWTPFTSSTVDTAITSIPKRLLLPGGVTTTVALVGRRNTLAGTQTLNYSSLAILPAGWA